MTIQLLIGDDRHSIEQHIQHQAAQLDSTWKALNYHRFDVSGYKPDTLRQLLRMEIAPIACTFPLSGQKLITVEGINLSGLTVESLDWLKQLPDTTHIVLTNSSLDRRLKVTKWLLKLADVQEFNLLHPWQTKTIADIIEDQAKTIELELSSKGFLYLAEAIGHNPARIDAELQKIKLYAQSTPLTLSVLQSLVPNHTQTALQLAEAVRISKPEQVIQLMNALENTHPSALVATLITQFRTWLWVKATLSDRQTKRTDTEIAQLCGIGNPRRLYYLRQEVADLSLLRLIQTLSQLTRLSYDLKHGRSQQVLYRLLTLPNSTTPAKLT
jgi:DNA polymerase-3 subunit delta